MPQPERFEVLVLGSRTGGKLIAWHLAQSGQRTAVVERRWIGGSCPCERENRASRPLWRAVWHGDRSRSIWQRFFGASARWWNVHLQIYKTSGAELIMGNGHFVAPKTVEVERRSYACARS